MMDSTCVLCSGDGGLKVYDDGRCRVVIADEPFAGFCRVIWNAHVREMTDLAATERDHLMGIVFAVEAALRAKPTALLYAEASLGNVVPHLHWHVIPRFENDSHFPNPVWGAPKRRSAEPTLPPNFAEQLAARLARG